MMIDKPDQTVVDEILTADYLASPDWESTYFRMEVRKAIIELLYLRGKQDRQEYYLEDDRK